MQMKSMGVVSTQYAYFLSSTLSDPLSAVHSGTQYFWKLLMICCYEPLSACLALFVIRLSGGACWKTVSLPRHIKRVCPLTEENVPLMSFLYTANGNVDKCSLPWSTCFVVTLLSAQQHKRANYEKDELGWGAGWAASYFATSPAIVPRYYSYDVNFSVCVFLCMNRESALLEVAESAFRRNDGKRKVWMHMYVWCTQISAYHTPVARRPYPVYLCCP